MIGKELKELEVAVLGAGAVARTLSTALVRGGLIRSLRVWARNEEVAIELRDELRGELETQDDGRIEIRSLGDLEETVSGAELVLLCVVDDALEELATRVAVTYPEVEEGAVALHLSGFASTDLLEPLADGGFATGGMHPLLSLAGTALQDKGASSPFVGAHFALGGDEIARARARQLATALGGLPVELASSETARALYHGAASLLAGGTVALFDAAERMLEGALEGDQSEGRAALMGLLQSTVRNLESGAAEDVLTGPIHRGDRETVKGHLAALSELTREASATSSTEALYRQVSLSILELARRRGNPDALTIDQIGELLSRGSNNS